MRDIAVGTDLDIVVRGDFPADLRPQIRAVVGKLVRYTDLRIVHVRVKVTHAEDQRVIGEASLELAGRRIRAQVVEASAGECLDLLADVVRYRISRLQQHWEALVGSGPDAVPAQWSHPAERQHTPAFAHRPAAERNVVRHKRFELSKCNVNDAIEDLELAGYRFHLFADVETGQESIVHRGIGDRYRVITLSQCPVLDEAGALARMNRSGRAFCFYADRVTREGRVIYRRFDGNYGVISGSRDPHGPVALPFDALDQSQSPGHQFPSQH